jgi:iron(III) transport system substrate-binding protein
MTRAVPRVLFFGFFLSAVIVLPVFAQSDWRAEWQKVLDAAQKEGKVVVGVSPSADVRRALENGFGSKFKGIQLELVTGASSMIASKILNEYRAGVRNVDVFIAGSESPLSVVAHGAAEPFEPYMILPEVRDPKYWFGGHFWVDNKTTQRFIYPFQAYITEPGWANTELYSPESFRSYDELLNPQLNGKIGFHDPRMQGAGRAMWLYLWGVKGEDYLKKLVSQNLLLSDDHRQLGDALAKGKVSIILGPGYRVISFYSQAGLPIKPLPVPKEGIHATRGIGAVTVIKNPPHPNATRVFVNWLLSKEGQEIFGKAIGQATRRHDVDTRWLKDIGIQAAKDVMSVEEYHKRESSFEDRVDARGPGEESARRLLK